MIFFVYENRASALAQIGQFEDLIYMMHVFVSVRTKYCKVSSATKDIWEMDMAAPVKRNERFQQVTPLMIR